MRVENIYIVTPASTDDPDAVKWAGRRVTIIREHHSLGANRLFDVVDIESLERHVFRDIDLKEE